MLILTNQRNKQNGTVTAYNKSFGPDPDADGANLAVRMCLERKKSSVQVSYCWPTRKYYLNAFLPVLNRCLKQCGHSLRRYLRCLHSRQLPVRSWSSNFHCPLPLSRSAAPLSPCGLLYYWTTVTRTTTIDWPQIAIEEAKLCYPSKQWPILMTFSRKQTNWLGQMKIARWPPDLQSPLASGAKQGRNRE